MKKLVLGIILVGMTVFSCSCDDFLHAFRDEDYKESGSPTSYNNDNKTEKYYSYKVLWTHYGSPEPHYAPKGLAILYGDDSNSEFVMFDDEASYYNKYIYEWYLAFYTGFQLASRNGAYKDKDKIENYLNCIHCMPNCLDKYGVNDSETREWFMEAYYDLRERGIYEPTRRYGSWKYPYENDFSTKWCIELFRIKEGEFENIPGGTLGIHYSSF